VRTTAVNVEEDYGPMQSQLVFKAVGESEKSTKNVYSGESNQGGLEFISTKEDPIVEQNRLAQVYFTSLFSCLLKSHPTFLRKNARLSEAERSWKANDELSRTNTTRLCRPNR